MTPPETLRWNRVERELRTVPERLAIAWGENEGAVFDHLWRARGDWEVDAAVAEACRLPLAAVQGAVRRLKRDLYAFELFIVSCSQSPIYWRLVKDQFAYSPARAGSYSRSPQAGSANDFSAGAGKPRGEPAAPSSSPVRDLGGDSSAARPEDSARRTPT